MKKTINSGEVISKKKDADVVQVAKIIEFTLESFGILAIVKEINQNQKDTDYYLDVAVGTPLENILKLNKDIALAVASPTGDVQIAAPIPGRSLIGITVPLGKLSPSKENGKYKVIRIETEKIVYKGVIPQLKNLFLDLLKVLISLLSRLVVFIEK